MNKNKNKLTCKVVEVTTSYIALLIDGYDYIRIKITKYDNDISIKRKILDQLLEFEDPSQINEPFDSINDIPIKLHSSIDIEELKKEMYEITSDYTKKEKYVCEEIRHQFYPSLNEFIDAVYQKEINNNSEKYNNIMEKISLSYELIPENLGEKININQFEELLNGL